MSIAGTSQPDFTHLFDDQSVDVRSPIFRILPGHVWHFMAFNFMSEAHRDDPLVVPSFSQEASLFQIVRQASSSVEPTFNECGVLTNYEQIRETILVEGEVIYNGCCCIMDACNTVLMLDIPGDYRFVLNDKSALQTVRIVARWYNKDVFPYGVSALFGR